MAPCWSGMTVPFEVPKLSAGQVLSFQDSNMFRSILALSPGERAQLPRNIVNPDKCFGPAPSWPSSQVTVPTYSCPRSSSNPDKCFATGPSGCRLGMPLPTCSAPSWPSPWVTGLDCHQLYCNIVNTKCFARGPNGLLMAWCDFDQTLWGSQVKRCAGFVMSRFQLSVEQRSCSLLGSSRCPAVVSSCTGA